MSQPEFSILLPSRNRLQLLKAALESVRLQTGPSFEVIVSDNFSNPPYPADLLAKLGLDGRMIRQDVPLSVTRNWNAALDAAQGRYIVMLGDDDALTVGFLSRLLRMIEAYNAPDLLYVAAYHYYMPGVVAGFPNGAVMQVRNSRLFDADAPFRLDHDLAKAYALAIGNFRHLISFNAQHFIWKREFIAACGVAPFFQTPYPDYFAAVSSFLLAGSIVVLPTPDIIIGVSDKSFGAFLMGGRENAGHEHFLHDAEAIGASGATDSASASLLKFPGSQHYRNWLLVALAAREIFGKRFGFKVDMRRYRRLQAVQLLKALIVDRSIGRDDYSRALRDLPPADQNLLRGMRRMLETAHRLTGEDRACLCLRMEKALKIYHPARVVDENLGFNRSIGDAVSHLAARSVAASGTPLQASSSNGDESTLSREGDRAEPQAAGARRWWRRAANALANKSSGSGGGNDKTGG